jgi:HPt (histidine-containing phosphotransfer) domain-containing protein
MADANAPDASDSNDLGAGGQADQNVLDHDRLRVLHDLTPDSTALFDRFVASFIDTAPVSVERVRAAVVSDDAEALTSSAHQLKGSALNLGVPIIGALCLDLEVLGDEGHTRGADVLLTRLDVELERAIAALREVQAVGLD